MISTISNANSSASESRAVSDTSSQQEPSQNDRSVDFEEVSVSESGKNINTLFLMSRAALEDYQPPIYLTVEKRLELVKDKVTELAQNLSSGFTDEQISTITNDLKTEFGISELPTPDVNAPSGSVYSFLTDSDRAKLSEAYQYALDNNTSLKDVSYAAFSLGDARFVEAKISSGTIYGVIDTDDSSNEETTEIDDQGSENESTVREKTDYIKSLLAQLEIGQLFSSNPFLRDSLLQDASAAMLTNTLPEFINQNSLK